MDLIFEGLSDAFWLLFYRDSDVVDIILLTLRVSGFAIILATGIGVPLGAFLGVWQFRGRGLAISIVNTGMGAPPVVVGLVVMILLWRSGVLGGLGILYTPWAMVLAQTVLALPIVVGFTMAAIAQIDPLFRLQLLALGASQTQAMWILILETRLSILAAVMMVGGNIKGETRVLTTATVMESNRGEFGTAIALGSILLALTFAVIALLTYMQQRSRVT